jgi:hypothetical protein
MTEIFVALLFTFPKCLFLTARTFQIVYFFEKFENMLIFLNLGNLQNFDIFGKL